MEALLTDALRAERPDAGFSRFTHVDDLAEIVAGMWDRPATDLNGIRLDLAQH